MDNVYGHRSWDRVMSRLGHILDMLPQPVRALSSTNQHLGIDPNQWITQYAICPECKLGTSLAFSTRATSFCTMPVPDCNGVVYAERRDAKGKMALQKSIYRCPLLAVYGARSCIQDSPNRSVTVARINLDKKLMRISS
ncbi:hypothetical protein DEU56DRAFT_462506 [Suillus clintonianus]|uniref:uncharacterized protein n=1 Tax=Suillus clintonianus TaxID=1904413 RepID=UPI001B878D70|nr:uncharacterized protein DEU56DRAFT_462506 [Suillus clintonianus]KAG2130878.1 hypothetical protein DEU56DRAFT_462506 [Suillus clintonianus]